MKKRDISERSLAVLGALAEMGQGTRRSIAHHMGTLDAQKVSSTLNRLYAMGLVDEPDRMGGGWTISAAGRALLESGESDPTDPTDPTEPTEPTEKFKIAPIIMNEPEPNEPEPTETEKMTPIPEPQTAEPVDPESPQVAEMIRALELELALDRVKRLLRQHHIPARAARVYRELLASLPPVIADELNPITQLLDPQP